MVDILTFIDTEEIREYNRKTVLTPIEQAILIGRSKKTTVAEKLAVWQELLHTYDEQTFQQGQIGRWSEKKSYRKMVEDEIRRYEKRLSYLKDSQGAIFAARLEEREYPRGEKANRYFSEYEKAFAYLQKEWSCYEEEELRDCEIYGVIEVKWLDYEGHDHLSYVFNRNLEMTEVDMYFEEETEEAWLSECYMYLPLPFQPGDLVRIRNDREGGGYDYGVIRSVLSDEKSQKLLREKGDCVDMNLIVDRIHMDKAGRCKFSHEHWPFLEIAYCPKEELPQNQQILEKLSEVYKGNLHTGNFPERYVNLQEEGEG